MVYRQQTAHTYLLVSWKKQKRFTDGVRETDRAGFQTPHLER